MDNERNLMAPYTIELPYPPSVNGYWRNIGRGRTIVSKAGRDYTNAVMLSVLTNGRPRTFQGRLSMQILVHPPDKRRRDLDNVAKGIQDSLCKASVYADDSQIDRLLIERAAVTKPGKVVVTVWEMN
jgi:crossover junction endodeoxyribonuclease RusA